MSAQEMATTYAWKLSNGIFVHPVCREAYQKSKSKGSGIYPSIESGVFPGFETTGQGMNRFTLCGHCQAPIWDNAKAGGAR